MYHSVTFGNKNCYDEWRLVPSSRPVINPPKPKVQYVDIPGADGSIDLTESLAGRPVFEDREGSLEFIVLNDFNVDNYDYNWIDVYTSVMQYLHGQRMTLILDDDPDYYYEGRFTVNSWKSDQNNSTITIDYRLSPYKYHVSGSFSVSDFQDGALGESGIRGDSNYQIVEDDSNHYARRLITPRECQVGDTIHISGNYQLDVGLYSGTVESPTAKDFVWAAFMKGKSYTFKENGVYRIDIRKYDRDGVVTQDDYALVAEAVHMFTGGVL